jgi:CDP-diacylglycerol--glycerol-3-phosphate 3-phosphatidyltransferase
VKDDTPLTTYRELHRLAIGGSLAIAAIATYLHQWLPLINCFYMGLSGVVVWLYSIYLTQQRAGLNRRDEQAAPYPSLGWANRLSLLRAWLIALTSGFLWVDLAGLWLVWLPGIWYSIAAILDRIDGFVARRSKQTSLLGMELDTLFDALGLLIAPTLAVLMGKLHWSFLAVSLAFYSFSAGIWYRKRHGKPVYPLLPSQLRRAFAGIQMGFVAVVLLPLVPAVYTRWLGIAFMTPLLIGFLVDWLVVSGAIAAHTPSVSSAFTRLKAWSNRIALPLLRWLCSLSLAVCLIPVWSDATPSTYVLGWCVLALLFGIAARTHGLIALLTLCLDSVDINSLWALSFTLCTWVLLLGPGNWNLWKGDDTWVNRQDGAE